MNQHLDYLFVNQTNQSVILILMYTYELKSSNIEVFQLF